jgi:hypothetical protein
MEVSGQEVEVILKTREVFIMEIYTVEPPYNDIGLYYTSSIASDILRYQLIPDT